MEDMSCGIPYSSFNQYGKLWRVDMEYNPVSGTTSGYGDYLGV